jgi:DNA-binding NarL/FixJ family response regulator
MRNSESHPINVLVVSDSHLVRSGLRKILEHENHIHIVAEIGFDRMGADIALNKHTDLVLFDLDPRGNDIFAAIVSTQKAFEDAPILVLTDLADHELARRALSLGAHGVALKIQPPAVLIAAVRSLCPPRHSEVLSEPAARDTKKIKIKNILKSDISNMESIRKIGRLTNREREIIRLLGLGLKNKDTATRLSISDITVRHHLTSIFRKLEVPDRQNLLIFAHRFGLVELTLSAEPV